MRHKMKQNKPNKIVTTIRKAPVLLLKSVLPLFGSRSACVTAIFNDPFGFFGAQTKER
jgi:hypothetical protein